MRTDGIEETWAAIRIQGIRIQYTNNETLIIQGKKEDREEFARHLQAFAQRERLEEERRMEEVENDPELHEERGNDR